MELRHLRYFTALADCLNFTRAAERVHVTPDCGFSQTARHIAARKLANMVEGVRRVRRELKKP